ncbi:MAG: UbiD family decarboxylase, partial [Actinobacteria bacterium]|nr:UbiD family decarboxylase [Actinomycetota bacterium]
MNLVDDLRSYIAALEAAGQLAMVSKPVSLEYELADVAAALERSNTGAALFSSVTDSPWPIFSGGVASHRRAALALGCQPIEIPDVMGRVLEPENGVAPVRVTTAQWHDNQVTGDDI